MSGKNNEVATVKQAKKNTRLTDYRELVRFLTLLNVPWLAWLTGHLFGVDHFEFETEIVVLSCFLIFGSFWCGWVCPFGNLSHFISRIGTTLFPHAKILISAKIDAPLRYLKYFFLAIFIYTMIIGGINYFLDDHMIMYKANWLTSFYFDFKKFAILLIPLLVPRFFCKYLCFQKAAYNLINKVLKIAKIYRDPDKCISCKKCERVCPMQLPVSSKKEISGSDCLGCYNCVDEDVCPEKADAIEFRYLNHKVSPLHFAFVVIAIYLSATWIVLKLVSGG